MEIPSFYHINHYVFLWILVIYCSSLWAVLWCYSLFHHFIVHHLSIYHLFTLWIASWQFLPFSSSRFSPASWSAPFNNLLNIYQIFDQHFLTICWIFDQHLLHNLWNFCWIEFDGSIGIPGIWYIPIFLWYINLI